MPRYDLETLGDLLELRKTRENELIEAAARATAALGSARLDEERARQLVDEQSEALRVSDDLGKTELDESCTAAVLAERAGYRKSLVAALARVSGVLGEHVARRKEAERALELVRRELAEAAAKRSAAEKLLARAELEVRRTAEDRLDDEIAELAGARVVSRKDRK